MSELCRFAKTYMEHGDIDCSIVPIICKRQRGLPCPAFDDGSFDKAVDELIHAIVSDIGPAVQEFMVIRKKPDAIVPMPQLRCRKYIELVSTVQKARKDSK